MLAAGQNPQWSKEKFEEKLSTLDELAQELSADESISEINTMMSHGIEKHPHLHVDFTLKLINAYVQKGDEENIIKYVEQTKELILKYGIEEDMWKHYLCKGLYLNMSGDNNGSLKHYHMAVNLMRDVKPIGEKRKKMFKAKLAGQIHNIGSSYFKLNKLDSAQVYFNEALAISKEIDDQRIVNKINNKLGHIAYYYKDYLSAASFYSESYNYSKDNNNGPDLTICSAYMARLYLVLGQYEKALKYYEEVIVNAKQYKLLKILPTVYLKKAEVHIWLEQYGEAQETLDMAVNDTLSMKNNIIVCYGKMIQAIINQKNGKDQTAIQQFRSVRKECSSYFTNEAETSEINDCYYGIANYHVKKGRWQAAMDTLAMGLKAPLRLKPNIEFLKLKTEILKNQGLYKKALEASDELKILKDSMLSLNKVGVFLTEQANLEANKKQLRIEKLESEKEVISLKNRQKRNIIIGLIGSIFLLGAMAWFYSRHRKIREEKELTLIQQQLLRRQINPQFVFNTLKSVQSSFVLNDEERTLHLFSKFSNLMRLVLENSTAAFIPLNEELSLIKNYLDLELARTNNNFQYTIHQSNDIDSSYEKVPSMVLQVLVENAIQHCQLQKEGVGLIEINLKKEKDKLKIDIDNSHSIGKQTNEGLSLDLKNKKTKSIALINEHLKLLNKRFNKNIQLVSEKGQNGLKTKVSLSF